MLNQLTTKPWLRELIFGVLGLAGVGLVAIGISGVLAAGFGQAFGKDFVAGDPSGVTYTPERCADFLEYYPNAPDCTTAALMDHYDEVVFYRLAAGVLGLGALAAYFVARRRWPIQPGQLPSVVLPTAGAVAFGLAALALLGQSASQLAFGSNGEGALLSGGLVSAMAFLPFAQRFLRSLP